MPNFMPSQLFIRKYLLSSALMIIGMFFTLNFFAMGCVIDLAEQIKFAIGAFIYCIGTLIFVGSESITIRQSLRRLPIFLLLNVICSVMTYVLKSTFLITFYDF